MGGGIKNNMGNDKISTGNVIVFPGIDNRSAPNYPCQTNAVLPGTLGNMYIDNDCITQDGKFYSFADNPMKPEQNPITARNRFYSPGAKFDYNGKTLRDLQRAGMDIGSTVDEVPSVDEIIRMGRSVLDMNVETR